MEWRRTGALEKLLIRLRNLATIFFHAVQPSKGHGFFMISKLSKELIAALQTSRGGTLEFVDPDTKRTYVLVESEVHRDAMEALRRQQDYEAIAEGIAEMEAGGGLPIEEAHREALKKLPAAFDHLPHGQRESRDDGTDCAAGEGEP